MKGTVSELRKAGQVVVLALEDP